MENKPSMAEMSGETSTSPKLVLNEISLNGKKGRFVYTDKKGGLIEKDGKKRYAQEDLGESVRVVFMRIRRRLRQFRKDQKPLVTNEHNTKADMLTLFGEPSIIKGGNDDLKAKYPNLRTNQVVYCLFSREGHEDEVVRLIVRGSSLGSKAKAKEVHDFYTYISSFKADGADDHFYDFVTELYAVEEKGDLGEYYAMSFRRAEELDQEAKGKVSEKMIPVFNFIKASDAYYQTKRVEEIQKTVDKARDEDVDVIEYPEDEINPEDIPF